MYCVQKFTQIRNEHMLFRAGANPAKGEGIKDKER